MAVSSSASFGFSPDYTSNKQDIFAKFLGFHIRAVRGIVHKQSWAPNSYFYYDLNGGPGVYRNGLHGSPVLFISESERVLSDAHVKKNFHVHIHIFESNKKTFLSLVQSLAHHGRSADMAYGGNEPLVEYYRSEAEKHDIITLPFARIRPPESTPFLTKVDGPIFLINRSHDQCVDWFPAKKETFGLVYSDENGAGIPLYVLKNFAERMPRMDILVHCSATAIKRTREAFPGKMSFYDIIRDCPKKVWHIREPFGRWQWTFLYGSNWEQAPVLKKQLFHHMDTERGQEIFDVLDRTREERARDESKNYSDC